MCTIEQALPYVLLAVACPAMYEAIIREKLATWAGTSKDVFSHRDRDPDREGEGASATDAEQ